MEIEHLASFLAVTRCGSFTLAAEKIFRSQPAISLHIKALERDLGVSLFDRAGARSLSLTPEGQILYELASPLLEAFSSLKTRFDDRCKKVTAQAIVIVTHESVMLHFLPPIIKEFKAKYPNCELRIYSRSRAEIVKMISDGTADLGISSLDEIPSDIRYSKFAEFRRVLISHPEHPITTVKKITLSEIVKYPLILPTLASRTRRTLDSLLQAHELSYVTKMEVRGSEAIKTYVRMGLGIAVANEYNIEEEDKKFLFVRRLGPRFGVAESGIITKKGKYLPEVVNTLISLLTEKKQVEIKNA